jgi:hypothetical protein
MTGTIDPALFGMPNAATAGVPPGTTLTAYTGPLTITTNGTVIEGKIIDGATLRVLGDNVTIKNCVIKNYGTWGIDAEGAANITVQNCDFIASSSKETNAAILGSGTFIGNDISNSSNGIVLQGGASVVRDNYIHDLRSIDGDAHIDGISVQGGQNNVLIEHNTIESWDTSCIIIKNDFGPINNITVRNNLMYADADRGDPAATVYVYGPNVTNVSIVDNYVEKGYWFYYSTSNANPTISGNIEWDNKTDPIPYPASAPTQPSAPSAPTIASFSNDTGKVGDGITSDNTLQLKGAAAAGSTIKIYDGSTQIGTATASSTGSWEYITNVLSNAKHVLTATATSSSGQTSAASGAVTVTVDTVAPTIPVLSSNTLVNSNQVRLSGTAEANSTITIYEGNTVVGTGTTNSAGAWSITTNALSTGTHTLTAKAADAAGNVSTASTSISTAITGNSPAPDTVAPTAPVVSSNTVVNTNQVKLSGTAEANSAVTIYDGNTVVGTGTTNSTGTWSITTNALSNGTHALTAKATDAAGNVSGASQSVSSVIGGTLPTNPATEIESSGATTLVEKSDKYYLTNSNGTGPVLKFDGAPVTDSTWAGWAPIGAEKTATGYNVVWKNATTGQYNAWTTDNNGNYVTNTLSFVSGTNSALKSLETSFNQDLNGDGTIGASTVVIESAGSTSLSQIGSNYFLKGSSGPDLKFGGSPVTDSTWAGWAPIAAEQTATGFNVVWKNAATGQYNAWTTDSSGNYITNTLSFVSGTNTALKSLEASFNQDLNGDGTIGAPTVVIESAGSTSLSQIGSNYFLKGSSGPVLKFDGAPVTEGMWAGWAPIGAEQTATGFNVVWKNAATGQFNAWSTDSNGNYITNSLGLVSGTNTALKSLEGSFNQDLNGDGSIDGSSGNAPISSVGLTTMYKNWSDSVTIEGVAAANSQIKLFDGNTSLGTVTTDADGTWSFKTSSAVSDTVHTYTAKQIDSSGQVVGSSGSAILGSTGSNTLKGTSGDDILVGGGQSDTFVFASNFGRDIIRDFKASGSAQDTIQFSKTVFDNFASVLSHASQSGQDVVISTGNDTLTLKNTKLSALNSSDFHFA